MLSSSTSFLAVLLVCSRLAAAYIPAVPINDTNSLNRTDDSKLIFQWVKGVYSADISLQLSADVNTSDYFPNYWANGGVNRGALVYFSESQIQSAGVNDSLAYMDASITPWIAFIACDSNATLASQYYDIFTLARDRGAMAALLYSNSSAGCQISQEYLDDYEKPLDVYTTKNSADTTIIQSQFQQHCDPAFWNFNPAILNSSFLPVTTLLNGSYPTTNSYVVSILQAWNATATVPTATPDALPTASAPQAASSKGPGTSLAMIILYSITGVIVILFIIVVVSGAIRALRNPDRYGPRGSTQRGYPYNFDDPTLGGDEYGHGGGPAQTRAGGLARAILDTFPVVKFVRGRSAGAGDEGAGGGLADGKTAPGGSHGGGARGGAKAWEMPVLDMQPSYTRHDSDYPEDEDDKLVSSKSNPTARRSTARSLSTSLSSDPGSSPGSGPSTSRRNSAQPFADFGSPDLASGGDPSSPFASPRTAMPFVGAHAHQRDELAHVEQDEENCAICLLEFEEGDDLRVLPCSEGHRFHKDCIDNWLVDINPNCPLCRKDFSLAPIPSPTPSQSSLALPAGSTALAGAGLPSSSSAAGPSRIQRYLANVRSTKRASLQAAAASSGDRGPGPNSILSPR